MFHSKKEVERGDDAIIPIYFFLSSENAQISKDKILFDFHIKAGRKAHVNIRCKLNVARDETVISDYPRCRRFARFIYLIIIMTTDDDDALAEQSHFRVYIRMVSGEREHVSSYRVCHRRRRCRRQWSSRK